MSTLRAIAADVCARHGLSHEDLVGYDRSRRATWPRQEFMYLARTAKRRIRHSYPAIGLYLGGRDHTTALHGARAHALRHGLPPPPRCLDVGPTGPRPWSADEWAMVKAAWPTRELVKDISKRVGRTPHSISSRASRMGLPPRRHQLFPRAA